MYKFYKKEKKKYLLRNIYWKMNKSKHFNYLIYFFLNHQKIV